jgi:predicted ATP-binding protein involved in virulence
MRIERLTLNNFRGIENLDMQFSETESTVFIGTNGAGKSSLLDCITNLLKNAIDHISEIREAAVFKDTDVQYGSNSTRAELFLSFNSKKGSIVVQKDLGRATISSLKGELASPGKLLLENADKKFYGSQLAEEFKNCLADENSPLVVSYGSNRLVSAFDLGEPISNQSDPLSAYRGSLDRLLFGFEEFFKWFRSREDIENEHMRDDSSYMDHQLASVRKSIYQLVPDFQDLRVRRSPLRMTVKKNNQELIVEQLSDGEKCLLAMVGDIARRLAILNQGLNDPLQGTGVVLIDEIELHLHPGWQYKIIPALTRTVSLL